MYPFCSFLQAVCQLVKHIFTPMVKMTRRLYRSAAILMTGTAVVAVMTFSSAGFAAGGHNAHMLRPPMERIRKRKSRKRKQGKYLGKRNSLQKQRYNCVLQILTI